MRTFHVPINYANPNPKALKTLQSFPYRPMQKALASAAQAPTISSAPSLLLLVTWDSELDLSATPAESFLKDHRNLNLETPFCAEFFWIPPMTTYRKGKGNQGSRFHMHRA